MSSEPPETPPAPTGGEGLPRPYPPTTRPYARQAVVCIHTWAGGRGLHVVDSSWPRGSVMVRVAGCMLRPRDTTYVDEDKTTTLHAWDALRPRRPRSAELSPRPGAGPPRIDQWPQQPRPRAAGVARPAGSEMRGHADLGALLRARSQFCSLLRLAGGWGCAAWCGRRP
jgi:hypothetical protein